LGHVPYVVFATRSRATIRTRFTFCIYIKKKEKKKKKKKKNGSSQQMVSKQFVLGLIGKAEV
jgi:hypothetical protein